MKNLSLLGAALLITVLGAGPVSLDTIRSYAVAYRLRFRYADGLMGRR